MAHLRELIEKNLEKDRQDAVAKYEKDPHTLTVREMSALPASYHETNRSVFTKAQNQAFDEMQNELRKPANAKLFEKLKQGFDLNANIQKSLFGELSESKKLPQPMFRADMFKPPEYKDTHWHSLGEQISETIQKQGKENITEQHRQMKLLRREVWVAIVLGIISCLTPFATSLFE